MVPITWAGIRIVIASMLWSTIGVASLYGGDVVLVSLIRTITASTISALFVRSRSKASIIAGSVLGALFFSYLISVLLAGVGPAAYLLYTAPLWSSLIAIKYGERLSKYSVISISLIIASIALMVLESTLYGTLTAIGITSGLISGIIYGVYISITRYYSVKGLDKEVSLGAIPYTLVSVLPASIICYTLGRVEFKHLGNSLIAGIYLAIFCTIIPYRLFSIGAKYLSASTSAVLASVEPVFACMWDYVIFSKVPSAPLVIAYALITLASIIASTRK